MAPSASSVYHSPMFEELVASGEALLLRLESNVELGLPGAPLQRPGDVVSFRELHGWYSGAIAAVTRTLGADPRARLEYMWQLFADEWNAVNRATPASLESFRGLIYLLRGFSNRLDPSGIQRRFDWSQSPEVNREFPGLPEIEAKRWEFFRAMLQDAQHHAPGTFDPQSSANRIGLHPIHAREFFVSLVSSGHVNREWLTPEWRQLAEEIDGSAGRGADVSPPAARSLSVFLCHASEDKAAVRELSSTIRKWGHDPWLDEDKLLPGQDWDREIRRAIESADIVVVCLSAQSEKRGYVQKEIKRALDIADEQPEGAIYVIPVKLTECSVPDRLRQTQWVNLSVTGGPSKLEAALRLCADKR